VAKLERTTPTRGVPILLMPIDLELSEFTAGGVNEPRADWTRTADELVGPALQKHLDARSVRLVGYPRGSDGIAALTPEDRQIDKLHAAVGMTILQHAFNEMNKLPTKGDRLDWTLGNSTRSLQQRFNADYALFVFVRDSYATAGRVAVILVGAVLGVGIQGGSQIGFASLVDLRTGDIVWFNRLARGTGDLRTAAAAQETVEQLLANFPQ